MKRLTAVFFGLFVLVAGASLAQEKEKEFNDWAVYSTTLDGRKTCYIASFPKNKSGNYSKRDEPYFLVTRINDNVYEVSTSSGYGYKRSSEVKLNVDGKEYSLFTEGELAWAHDSKSDSDIVDSMKNGKSLTVKGTSEKGTYSVDKYSLSGVTSAYDYMAKSCN